MRSVKQGSGLYISANDVGELTLVTWFTIEEGKINYFHIRSYIKTVFVKEEWLVCFKEQLSRC